MICGTMCNDNMMIEIITLLREANDESKGEFYRKLNQCGRDVSSKFEAYSPIFYLNFFSPYYL